MSGPPKRSNVLNDASKQEFSPRVTSESESFKNDPVQREVPPKAPVPLQYEKAAVVKSEAAALSPYEKPANASVAIKDNEKVSSAVSFAPGNEHTIGSENTSLTTASDIEKDNTKMPPTLSLLADHAASLIAQPLISTPGGIQLSALLRNESLDFHHGFTPRPVNQQGFTPKSAQHPSIFPTQSSVITNRTYFNTPTPGRLLMQSSASTNHTFSNTSTSVFGHPTSQEGVTCFNFGFTPRPMMFIPSASNQMPTPSPIFPISSQVAALGYSSLPKKETSPLEPGVHQKRIEAVARANKQQSKKKKSTKSKVTKPADRSRRPPVDVSAFMTLEPSTKACACPKNRCIKLYCECFHRGQICDRKGCECKKCLNTAEESAPTGARTKSVQDILTRKGFNAFKLRPKRTGVGCMCKKSRWVEYGWQLIQHVGI